MFKKVLILAVALTGLVACGKKDDAAAPATPDPAAAAPAATAPAAASVGAGLPQSCEAYLTRAKACFDKSNPQTAAAFQQGVDQAKAQWATMQDKTALEAGCKSANDQFAQVASALKCE
ncbi:DUF5339 domain-containing protein [Bacillus subtilis subsp. subtilis]|nr:DUF5339 domain-containing protein [Bacillus subtilis subsp. subtilis]